MFFGSIFGFVRGGFAQFHFDLQRRIAEQARKLRFGRDLRRHQIQDQQPKRTDILRDGPRFRDNKNVFALERSSGRKQIRYFDWHKYLLRSERCECVLDVL